MPKLINSKSSTFQQLALVIAPLISIAIMLFVDLDPTNRSVTYCLAIALLMAIWWITEAIPLFATALLPLALYPLLGIDKGGHTAPIYFNSTIVLFLGGFIIALTMERWRLHRRIALRIIQRVGGGPARIILGFMHNDRAIATRCC